MLRATLSTTIRAVRTKSTGTEPRCIAIPRNCPDGDASLIRCASRRASRTPRCKLPDAERADAHDGRRGDDNGSGSDHHWSRSDDDRRWWLLIGSGRRYIVERRSVGHGRILEYLDVGDEGRRAVHRAGVEGPSAAYVPPPAPTARS